MSPPPPPDAVKLTPSQRTVAESRQSFLVTIENLMGQPLVVSVLDEGGAVEGLRLAPRGKSRPVPVDRVGHYTHKLAARGRVRIVPQS